MTIDSSTTGNSIETMTTAGVIKHTIKPGDGKTYPKAGDVVEMHYNGHLFTRDASGNIKLGRKFDASFDRNTIFKTEIGVGAVIKGWEEGIPQMSLGETATLEITPEYAYGSQGFPNLIPPNEPLFFEVELLKINQKQAETYPRGSLTPAT
ncbi:hypothetical protein EX30DRAFT_317971 [Ascodesmis nigricans]|uniref:peptidylprolyl isomerase n=1 Tax=Ascodesmis nigricans TaxID=341454 RepID=A0A4S2N0S0_9PEZI|nr:hypothetical protein EX30DRAFT_317971 [Ascodesmis nigricans]